MLKSKKEVMRDVGRILNYKLTVQHRVTGTDENGYPYEEWQNFVVIWADKRGLGGREYYAAAAVQSEHDVVFTARYNQITSQITPEMRIIEGTVEAVAELPEEGEISKKYMEPDGTVYYWTGTCYEQEKPYNIKSASDRYGDKRWLEIRASR